MRNKETLVRELQFVAKCSEETIRAWWESLSSEEKKLIAEYYKEVLELVGMIAPPLATEFISIFQSFMKRLEPDTKEYFREMIDMLASLEGEAKTECDTPTAATTANSSST